MRTNIFNAAVALSDPELLAQTQAFAEQEREATAELVAHLAVLEVRPAAHAAVGYGSLFAYCTEALRLSEDAACTRIAAARWCRLFPVIADLMAAGSLSLTAVRLLGPHLTPENHEAVLARALGRPCKAVEALVAELNPQPDLAGSVRRLPRPRTIQEEEPTASSPSAPASATLWATPADGASPALTTAAAVPTIGGPVVSSPFESPAAVQIPLARGPRPVIKVSAPERYRVQFTIGQQAHDKLRRVQALLRREIPDGDPGLIFERFVDVLLKKVETEKLGAARSGRRAIRLETDRQGGEPSRSADTGGTGTGPGRPPRSRHVPAAVRSAVWKRDGAQCAFVAPSGNRCTERTYLEFHHVHPFARQGPSTVDNISLRCRRHNQYEGELIFGPRDGSKEPLGRDRQTFSNPEAGKIGEASR